MTKFKYRRSSKSLKESRLTRFALRMERKLQDIRGKKLWIITYTFIIGVAYVSARITVGIGDDLEEAAARYELKKAQYLADIIRIGEFAEGLDELDDLIRSATGPAQPL